MKRAAVLGLALILAASLTGLAQENQGAGAAFRNGVDARALGMGGAYVALADNYSASYWNPAGLAGVGGPTVGGMNTRPFGVAGWNFLFAGGALSINGISVGAMFANSTIDLSDVEGLTGGGSNNEMLIAGGGALSLAGLGMIGGGVRYYTHSLLDENASGLGFDAGVLLTNLVPGVRLGVAASDIGGTKKTWTTGTVDLVPMVIKLGAAVTLEAPVPWTLAAGADLEGPMTTMRVGAEFKPAELLALRAGAVKPGDGDFSFTLGAGLALGPLAVDIAWLQNKTIVGQGAGDTIVLSAEFRLP